MRALLVFLRFDDPKSVPHICSSHVLLVVVLAAALAMAAGQQCRGAGGAGRADRLSTESPARIRFK